MTKQSLLAVGAAALLALTVGVRSSEGQAQGPAAGVPPTMPVFIPRGPDAAGDRHADGRDGKQLFRRQCGYCHLQGGMGTLILTPQRIGMGEPPQNALLENRTDLTPDFVEAVARNGKGGMPRITRTEVTDQELKAIARYLAKGNE